MTRRLAPEEAIESGSSTLRFDVIAGLTAAASLRRGSSASTLRESRRSG